LFSVCISAAAGCASLSPLARTRRSSTRAQFYRYISERWPLINQAIDDASLLPMADALYLGALRALHPVSLILCRGFASLVVPLRAATMLRRRTRA
jgi:hypothetical protein